MPPAQAITLIPRDIAARDLRGTHPGATLSTLHGHTMGTYWLLQWKERPALPPALVHASLQRAFDLVIAQMSHFDPSSELSRINLSPPHLPHSLSPEFFHVLRHALQLSERSGGAYNPNLAALSATYGFGPSPVDNPPFPPYHHDQPWIHIHLDPGNLTLTHDLPRLHLDLSSIAKGHALDLAARHLEKIGIHDFLLEIGGEFLARGCKPNGHPWWIELENPVPTLPRLRFGLTRHALATSGSGLPPNHTVHHLLDPHTRAPTTHPLLSVTVLAAGCMSADAWATALFILGPDHGPALAEKNDISAIFTDHRRHHLSPQMKLLLDDPG